MVGLAEHATSSKSGEGASSASTLSNTAPQPSAWTGARMASMELSGRLDDDCFSGKWRFDGSPDWFEFELDKQQNAMINAANDKQASGPVTFEGHIKYMENNALTSVHETMQLRVSSGSHYSGIGKNVKFGNFELWGQRDEETKQFQGFKKYVPMNETVTAYKFVVSEAKQSSPTVPAPSKPSTSAPATATSSPALSLASTASSKRMRVAAAEKVDYLAEVDSKASTDRVEDAAAVFEDSAEPSGTFDPTEDLLSEFQLLADVPAESMGALSDDDLIIDAAVAGSASAPQSPSLVDASPLSKVAAMSAALRGSRPSPVVQRIPVLIPKRKVDGLSIATAQQSDGSATSGPSISGVTVRLSETAYGSVRSGADANTSKGRARRRVRDFVIGLQNRHFYPYDPSDVAHGLPVYHSLHDLVEVHNGDDHILRAPSASPSKLAAKQQHNGGSSQYHNTRRGSNAGLMPDLKQVHVRATGSTTRPHSVGKAGVPGVASRVESQAAKLEMDGSCYEGDLLGGLRHGHGVAGYYNGCVYIGEFRKGHEHGVGELRDAQGALLYRGLFESGRLSGVGTLYYPDGSVYRGDVRDGTRHGRGIVWYSDGSVYEGDFSHGERHGNGVFIYGDGSQYNGEWAHDLRHGKGVLKRNDGSTVDGQFKENHPEGRCVVYFADEDAEYEGNLKEGLKDGRGTYRFGKFNAIYEGRFARDCIGGTGTLKMDPEKVIELPNKTDESKSEWMIPVDLNCEVRLAHFKAGFGADGT